MHPMSARSPQLEAFLRHLHLGSEVYYVGQLCDAWHLSTPGGSDAVTFHLICHGEAWIHLTGDTVATRMQAGDIAFFPHDAAHAFSAQPVIPQQPFDYLHPHHSMRMHPAQACFADISDYPRIFAACCSPISPTSC